MEILLYSRFSTIAMYGWKCFIEESKNFTYCHFERPLNVLSLIKRKLKVFIVLTRLQENKDKCEKAYGLKIFLY